MSKAQREKIAASLRGRGASKRTRKDMSFAQKIRRAREARERLEAALAAGDGPVVIGKLGLDPAERASDLSCDPRVPGDRPFAEEYVGLLTELIEKAKARGAGEQ